MSRAMCVSALLSVVALLAVEADATTLSVDVGLTGQDVQGGYEAFSSSGTGTKSATFASALGTAGNVTVGLGSTNGWRDRRAENGYHVQHPIGDVVEDMAFTFSTMPVTLSDLKDGTYYFHSYHHDTPSNQGLVSISVTDANRTNRPVVQNLAQTHGTAIPQNVATVPLIFEVSGGNDAIVNVINVGSGVGVLSGFEVTDSPPAALKVDIGAQSGASNDVQAGFQSFAMINSNGSATSGSTASPQEHWFFTEVGNAGSVRVNISNPSNPTDGLSFRDRGDVSHPLGDLAEDFVFNNAGSGKRLDLTLGSLKPGRYTVTTYLHDLQGALGGGTVDVRVTDAMSGERLTVADVVHSAGAGPTAVASATFSVLADGVNPVVVHLDEDSAQIVTLNGFEAAAEDALLVDFGRSTGDEMGLTHDVQNGFVAFARSSSGTGAQTQSFSTSLGAGGSLSVTVDAGGSDTSIDWRDRGDVINSELGDLAEDFVFDHDHIQLVLDDLKAGGYFITTYHHDRHAGGWDPIDIAVTDAMGTARTVVEGLAVTQGTTGDPALATYYFASDGINRVTIDFTTTGSMIVPLNGFALTYVPEPASMTLFGLGGLALAMRRRRKA